MAMTITKQANMLARYPIASVFPRLALGGPKVTISTLTIGFRIGFRRLDMNICDGLACPSLISIKGRLARIELLEIR